MTLKYYVKGRTASQDTASPIVKAYGIDGFVDEDKCLKSPVAQGF